MSNVITFPHPAPGDHLPQLEHGERLFLWGFRLMAQHLRCECPIGVMVQRVYKQFLVEDAVGPLAALVGAFGNTAHTAIEIHAPDCPCVSEGEASLLRAMASAQSGNLCAAALDFEQWLPELAADWILGAADTFGRIFRGAGLTLPGRDLIPGDDHIGPAGSNTRH